MSICWLDEDELPLFYQRDEDDSSLNEDDLSLFDKTIIVGSWMVERPINSRNGFQSSKKKGKTL